MAPATKCQMDEKLNIQELSDRHIKYSLVYHCHVPCIQMSNVLLTFSDSSMTIFQITNFIISNTSGYLSRTTFSKKLKFYTVNTAKSSAAALKSVSIIAQRISQSTTKNLYRSYVHTCYHIQCTTLFILQRFPAHVIYYLDCITATLCNQSTRGA